MYIKMLERKPIIIGHLVAKINTVLTKQNVNI